MSRVYRIGLCCRYRQATGGLGEYTAVIRDEETRRGADGGCLGVRLEPRLGASAMTALPLPLSKSPL